MNRRLAAILLAVTVALLAAGAVVFGIAARPDHGDGRERIQLVAGGLPRSAVVVAEAAAVVPQ